MYNKARFNKLVGIPGCCQTVQQIKDVKLPKRALVIGDGNIYVTERPKLMLHLVCETGETIEKDIYNKVKAYFAIEITKKFFKQLEQHMKDYIFIVDNADVVNLDNLFLQMIK